MTERIEPVAGLHEYYRDLARVAPAEHQLAIVLARTADLAQRPAWRMRLPRLSSLEELGRLFPLRYALVAVATFLVALSVGVVGNRSGSPFEGRWTSTDVGDGSTQILDISGGVAPAVRFEDRMASGCADHGDPSVDFIAHGTAIAAGDRLVVDYRDGGGCTTWHVPAFTVTMTLDRSTGTMRDPDGNVWHRAP